jgi:hypothetical protein
MNPCIVIKEKQFQHQIVYTGVGDEVHCHFCGLSWPNKNEADEAFLWEKQLAKTKWPEGAEL